MRMGPPELEEREEPVRSAPLATTLEREEQHAGAHPVRRPLGAAAKRLRQEETQLAGRHKQAR